MPSFGHQLAAALIRIWLATSSHSWRRLPRPRGETGVSAPGPSTARLLVIGSGAVVGYGVLSHDLSVSGHLARLVAASTGRGVDVRIIADPDLDVRTARAELHRAGVRSIDVALVTLGSIDAIELLPTRDWGKDLGLLLDEMALVAKRVLLIGIPPIPALVRVPPVYSSAVARRCDALNAESARLAAKRTGVDFVPFAPPPIDLMQNASKAVHSVWARILAPHVVAALDG